MNKRLFIITAYISLCLLLFTGCSYKPPYQRGYDEGYAAGLADSGSSADGTGNTSTDEAEAAGASDDTENASDSKAGLSGLVKKEKKKTDKEKPDASDEDSAAATEASSEDTESSEETGSSDTAEDTSPAPAEGSSGAEVLGTESEPSAGPEENAAAAIPQGRIIAAEAVNEALYSNPEVIDGLRQIYPDTAIFGEYVGDSETNIIHKVDGPHFSSLTYNTIVVFDGSKSLQDILNEGFFTKCDCVD